ncbi:sulfite exporter TauE/SafE family protein [Actinophytocola gossypii]|uniref:Probable membrane transporter protein n=1 Tax=Actinophytocola gossypii TaxID=2812003 RepID=A0ABT2J227_9PSEU|nr:sulfite exporter TauE/SafE family protein [Actinophytocola gossypii]MCT2581821.1 sulfite exporter TauE/SafE family protein [Actinophytocola gossypii]
MDWHLVLAGVLVGFVVGLTGMGGGALMTPILVLFFKVDPLTAVSSDLLASVAMKPVGAAVHQRRGTVDMRLVRLLCYGSVPAAFCSVLLLRVLTDPASLQSVIRAGLAVALLLAVSTVVVRAIIERVRVREPAAVTVRPVPTVLVGVVGGLVVGVTSVGSGSLIIVALMLLYPGLTMARLVGTDLMQAIPLVGAAALGHLLFGDVEFHLTGALLLGALPAVYLGARLSSRAPAGLIRSALLIVLAASALKLLGASDAVVLWVGGAMVAVALLLLVRSRRKSAKEPVDRAVGSPGPPRQDQ